MKTTLGTIRQAASQQARRLSVTKYRIQRMTGLAPATVDRFFRSKSGSVRLDTALTILQALKLDLGVVGLKDGNTISVEQ